MNATEHAAAATVGNFLSFKESISATINPIIAEIKGIVVSFFVAGSMVMSAVELKISGNIIAESNANGIYLKRATRNGLVSCFLKSNSGTARNKYVINAVNSTA